MPAATSFTARHGQPCWLRPFPLRLGHRTPLVGRHRSAPHAQGVRRPGRARVPRGRASFEGGPVCGGLARHGCQRRCADDVHPRAAPGAGGRRQAATLHRDTAPAWLSLCLTGDDVGRRSADGCASIDDRSSIAGGSSASGRGHSGGRAGHDDDRGAALLHALLENNDTALDLLERAFERGWGMRDWIERDPDYDGLRDEPRFTALLARLKQRSASFPGSLWRDRPALPRSAIPRSY